MMVGTRGIQAGEGEGEERGERREDQKRVCCCLIRLGALEAVVGEETNKYQAFLEARVYFKTTDSGGDGSDVELERLRLTGSFKSCFL